MKKLLFITIIAATAMTLSASAQESIKVESSADEVITLWNNDTAPHSSCDTTPEHVIKRGSGYKVSHTSETVFYLFKAKNPTGHAMAYFPGGGYSTVNLNFGVAEWLRERGVTTLVVKYRLPNGHREVPLEDARAAIAFLRENAERLGINPQKVGVCGNSAGGHLAAWSSNVLPMNERPNFSVLVYPVINGQMWSYKGQWSTLHELLGKWRTPIDIEQHSADLLVTETTPPAIIFHSDDDFIAPTINSTLYYKALKRHGVKASLHIYPSGGHGWFSRESWVYRKVWLETLYEWIVAQ
ncbi:MAG: alpha/beta hydrolase [Alistipes sp.]|nr:alpha/beta hydrolase [Alistipes sp.]